MSLPAGAYLLQAKLSATNDNANTPTSLVCQIRQDAGGGPVVIDEVTVRLGAVVTAESLASDAVSLQAVTALGTAFTYSVTCASSGATTIITTHRILTALPVTGIN